MKKDKQIIREMLVDPVPLAIARLSRYYWEEDGSPEGSDMRYWLRAEAEVLAAHGMPLPGEPARAADSRSDR